MPTYKLYYFVNRGRAEAIRMLFHMCGEEFEDVRLTADTWQPIKNDMPLGQVPVLDVDGTKIGQSVAILRYLANQFDRAGKTALDRARLDMIGDVIQEMLNEPCMLEWIYAVIGMAPGDKNAIFKAKVNAAIEKHAPLVEKLLLDNGNNGLFLGDTETWVDVFAAESFQKFTDYGDANALEAFPHIKQLIARVNMHPKIKAYVEGRPKTPM